MHKESFPSTPTTTKIPKTNTIQQINARKVFKDAVAGTATSGNASYVDRAVEIQSLGSTSDALIAFHIPGVRGETFGVRANGDWVVSNGISPRKLWHEGNFDPSTFTPGLETPSFVDIRKTPRAAQSGLESRFPEEELNSAAPDDTPRPLYQVMEKKESKSGKGFIAPDFKYDMK